MIPPGSSTPARGDGIGIEVTRNVLRGVRLGSSAPGRLAAAAEVPIATAGDDRSTVDALLRLRAELGATPAPTRLALFPPGSILTRVDATGLTGSELNVLRSELATSRAASSSVLVDDGPRRWLVGVTWDDGEVRRMEDLTERAGFVDVAVDPSPLALARVLGDHVAIARRDAGPDESFAVVRSAAVVAAAGLDAIGRASPALGCGAIPVSDHWFDELAEAVELVAEITRLLDAATPVPCALELAGVPYPNHPPHDLRGPQRQCVALGAALGAAGLAGRLRPVDILLPAASTADDAERPWAIERVSNLPSDGQAASIGPLKRFVARLLPRRT